MRRTVARLAAAPQRSAVSFVALRSALCDPPHECETFHFVCETFHFVRTQWWPDPWAPAVVGPDIPTQPLRI